MSKLEFVMDRYYDRIKPYVNSNNESEMINGTTHIKVVDGNPQIMLKKIEMGPLSRPYENFPHCQPYELGASGIEVQKEIVSLNFTPYGMYMDLIITSNITDKSKNFTGYGLSVVEINGMLYLVSFDDKISINNLKFVFMDNSIFEELKVIQDDYEAIINKGS